MSKICGKKRIVGITCLHERHRGFGSRRLSPSVYSVRTARRPSRPPLQTSGLGGTLTDYSCRSLPLAIDINGVDNGPARASNTSHRTLPYVRAVPITTRSGNLLLHIATYSSPPIGWLHRHTSHGRQIVGHLASGHRPPFKRSTTARWDCPYIQHVRRCETGSCIPSSPN